MDLSNIIVKKLAESHLRKINESNGGMYDKLDIDTVVTSVVSNSMREIIFAILNKLDLPSEYNDILYEKEVDNLTVHIVKVLYETFTRRVGLEEDLSIEDDPEETEQEYNSSKTSINAEKLPAIFNMISFKENSINLDYGGGKYDNAAEYLSSKYGATNLVYDKYNRTPEHNREILETIRKNGGADTITCSNVLNVIAEESERLAVLRNCKRYLKSGGTCYVTIYAGDSTGEGHTTKSGYQLNRKVAEYEEEIKSVFPGAARHGRLWICR